MQLLLCHSNPYSWRFVPSALCDSPLSMCRLVRELRFARWEARAPLPRMKTERGACLRGPNSHWQASVLAEMAGGMPGAPDLGACILHQKLQMLDCCIFLLRHPDAAFISLSLPSTAPGPTADTGGATLCRHCLACSSRMLS